MTGTNKIAVLNTSAKIRTLKGQTKGNRKGSISARNFKSALMPSVLNMVPVAFWAIYKRQKIVQSWIDTGILVVGNGAEKKLEKVVVEKVDPAKVAEDAALAQLREESKEDGE